MYNEQNGVVLLSNTKGIERDKLPEYALHVLNIKKNKISGTKLVSVSFAHPIYRQNIIIMIIMAKVISVLINISKNYNCISMLMSIYY